MHTNFSFLPFCSHLNPHVIGVCQDNHHVSIFAQPFEYLAGMDPNSAFVNLQFEPSVADLTSTPNQRPGFVQYKPPPILVTDI